METLIYFLLWAGLIFVMMRYGCGAHIMGHGHKHGNSLSDRTEPGREAGLIPPLSDIDPVCGMTVETANAKPSVFGGRVYHFCSTDCRDKFEANPEIFAKSAKTASRATEHAHG